MGIDTAIRKHLGTLFPTAFRSDNLHITGVGHLLVDLPPVLFRLKRPKESWIPGDSNNELTGSEVVSQLTAICNEAFQAYAKTVVFCLDLEALVPKEKSQERQRRAANSHQHPYPDASVLSRSGIWLPGAAKPERMHMQRVMANRKLRHTLFRFLIQELQARFYIPPVGCVLMLDHCLEGVYCFGNSGWWLDAPPKSGAVADFGEADLKIPRWLRRYAALYQHSGTKRRLIEASSAVAFSTELEAEARHIKSVMKQKLAEEEEDEEEEEEKAEVDAGLWDVFKPKPKKPGAFQTRPGETFVIESIDSDQLPILLHFLHNMRRVFVGRIVVKYWNHLWLDVNELLHCIEAEEFMSAPNLVTLCVLGGTDYVEKDRYFRGVGVTRLFQHLTAYKCKARPGAQLHQVQRDFAVFEDLVTHIQQRRGKQVSKVEASSGVVSTVPATEELREVYESIQFNLDYWCLDWLHMEVPPPVLTPPHQTSSSSSTTAPDSHRSLLLPAAAP